MRSSGRRGNAQGGCRPAESVEHRAVHGFETAALRPRQVRGQVKVGQLGQRPLKTKERPFEGRCPRRAGGWPLRRQLAERIGQETPPIDGVGELISGDQLPGLGTWYQVRGDGGQKLVLVLARQSDELARQAGAEPALGHLVLSLRREASAQGQASLHPVARAPQQQASASHGQLVVVDQRSDDPCLVERGQRAWWSVGAEEQPLVRERRRRGLDDHRHLCVPLRLPAREALEAIQHLVGALAGLGHPQGQIGPTIVPRRERARTQLGVALPETADGNVANRTGRISIGPGHGIGHGRRAGVEHGGAAGLQRWKLGYVPSTTVPQHLEPWLALPTVMRDLHLQERAHQVARGDLVARLGLASHREVQVDQPPSRAHKPVRRAPFEHEVLRHAAVSRAHLGEYVDHLQHAVAVGTTTKAAVQDLRGIEARCGQRW
jgi:hypothetical protein